MTQKNKTSTPNTYTFFEPRNDSFFNIVAGSYKKLIVNNFEDSTKTFHIREVKGEEQITLIDKFFKNYYNDFTFPACNINTELNHTSIRCGTNRITTLTSTQIDIIVKHIDDALAALEAMPGTSNAIINKIRNRCPWLDKIDKTVLKKNPQSNRYLTYYATAIKTKIQNDVKKIVYVRAKDNSDYTQVMNEVK
jgi:hypothetical protein